ncbi:MAG: TetR/AcrR family transcriptional regulator [Bacteroidales bacterium]|nr:TetR/AcrR family transcriptional regulator [Bacteroidales bacterium]
MSLIGYDIKYLKREHIEKAALEIFAQCGYFSTTISMIVKNATVSKGLF